MTFSKRQFVMTIWLACFAMLMVALAPSASHLLKAAQSAPSMPMCRSSDGPSMGHDHGAGDIATLLVDCGYCSMQSDLPLLPPLPERVDGLVVLVGFATPFFLQTAARKFVWLSALSRAPPLL